MKDRPVLLIDSNAIIHRAYHAYPKTLTTKNGQLINAAFGFLSIVLQVIAKFEPSEAYFAFDSRGKTFRHKVYPEYKGTRKKTDVELIVQFKTIKEMLEKGKFSILELPGYEADDIIGTLSKLEDLNGKKKIIVTGDGDLLQLINSEVEVFLSGATFQKSRLFGPKTAEEKLGYPVNQVVEYKALRGDTSDNIPGVSGIGDVTAKKLLAKYSSLENLYTHIEEIDNSARNKLMKDRDSAFLSRDLATIDTKAPIDASRVNPQLDEADFEGLYKQALGLEFKSLLSKILKVGELYSTGNEEIITEHDVTDDVDNQVVKIQQPTRLTDEEFTTRLNTTSRLVIHVVENEQETTSRVAFLVDGEHVALVDADTKDYGEIVRTINSKQIKLVGFNTKELHNLHLRLGYDLYNFDFDISLAAYLLSSGTLKLDLESLSLEYLSKLPRKNTLDEELFLIEELYKALKSKIAELESDKWGIYKLLFDIELPLSPVLAKMESVGIELDSKFLKDFETKIVKKINIIQQTIYDQAGEEFNLASPKQLGVVLFEKLDLPGGKKGKSGGYSTNEKVLRNLTDHEIVRNILEYRELAKLKSTYTNTLLDQVDPKTNRIHSKFRQDVTATGRLSSIDPNLQNIPVSTELGQEVRKAFVAEEGKMFLFLDYSQQELRLLANLSKDKNLIDAYKNNIDIHTLTAASLLGKNIKEVTKSDRRVGKTVNFGIIYGISAFGLADRLKIDNKVAQDYIDNFFKTYPEVRNYFDKLLDLGKKQGYVETIGGRRKNTEGLNSNVFQMRKAVEREVLNFPLQGSAADMIKLAMVRADEILQNYEGYAQMVLQVHDELVFEINDRSESKKIKQLAKEMSDMMLSIFKLDVPMKVDVETGRNLAIRKSLLFE